MRAIFPWQQTIWARLMAGADRLPHALLLAGPAGGGKSEFARVLAERLLCETAQGAAMACGQCEACHWLAQDHHPDLRMVIPAADEESDAAEEKPATKSTQIRIDQIRELADFLGVGAVRGGRRVVVINPAEAMNAATANALLKLLEEPPARTQFLLVSDEPRKLLPTVRSRTQVWSFAEPDRAAALAFLASEGVKDAATWLDVAGGMPLLARDGASRGEDMARFLRDIESLPRVDAVSLAAQWESWVRPKAGGEMNLPTLTLWLQKWVFDLIAVKTAGEPRFFSGRCESLRTIASRIGLPALFGCYNSLSQMRRAASHPLNPRLFLDDMLLRYARLLPA